jgi:hypothetical protein
MCALCLNSSPPPLLLLVGGWLVAGWLLAVVGCCLGGLVLQVRLPSACESAGASCNCGAHLALTAYDHTKVLLDFKTIAMYPPPPRGLCCLVGSWLLNTCCNGGPALQLCLILLTISRCYPQLQGLPSINKAGVRLGFDTRGLLMSDQ